METDAGLALLQEVADAVIVPRFRALADGEVHEKNPGDLVTVADHEAEALITERLLAEHSAAVVLGEEAHSADPALMARFSAADHAFTLDPVDGTKNFVHGSADHAVMMSELIGGEAVRAWIWQPAHRVAWVAEKGSGTFRNGVGIHRAAPEGDPQEWRGVTSRRAWIKRALPGLRPLELTWVSCGIDYPRLIEGAADFIIYSRGSAWDHTPGQLLLAESGGHLGLGDGTPYVPTSPGEPLVAAASLSSYEVVVSAVRSSAP